MARKKSYPTEAALDTSPEAKGILYVVGTPIGNLEDISLRALRVLREVNLIASENPSWTNRLLARYNIHTPMMRYTDAYNRRKPARIAAALAALDEGDVALVSQGGMPGIADPGFELIQAAICHEIPVMAIPGPSALISALAVSGLRAERFKFLGFVPRKAGARRKLLKSLESEPYTTVCYESKHRLRSTLRDLRSILEKRRIAIACELTKRHEEIWRGTASEAIDRYDTSEPRGEYTIVIDGLRVDTVNDLDCRDGTTEGCASGPSLCE